MFTKDIAIGKIITFLLEKAPVIMERFTFADRKCLSYWDLQIKNGMKTIACLLVGVSVIIEGKLQSRDTSNKHTRFSKFNNKRLLVQQICASFFTGEV